MTGYRLKHTGSIKFDGKDVGYELKRLTVAEAMESRGFSPVQMDAYVRERLIRLDPVLDADGNPVPLDVIFSDFYFSPLCGQLALALFKTGEIPKAKLDPSAGSSSAVSTGEGSPAA